MKAFDYKGVCIVGHLVETQLVEEDIVNLGPGNVYLVKGIKSFNGKGGYIGSYVGEVMRNKSGAKSLAKKIESPQLFEMTVVGEDNEAYISKVKKIRI